WVHGSKPKYHHKIIGGNFRLDAIQAAVVSAKLPHLDTWTTARQRNAQRYRELFTESGLDIADSVHYPTKCWSSSGPQVFIPSVVTDRHIFNQYVIRVSEREALRTALQVKGIGTEVYYPVPLHLQECFAYLGHASGAFPESEKAAQETLALPI